MKTEPISIPLTDELHLAGVLHLPDRAPGAGVVICHGMLSHKGSDKHVAIADGLCARGLAALRFDFQGRGESPGDMLGLTISRQMEEARAAMACLRERTGVVRLGLVGSSLGGAVAILIAASEPAQVAGLVTLAAVGRTDIIGQRLAGPKGMAAWGRKGRLRLDPAEGPVGYGFIEDGRRHDLPGAGARVGCPWLIVHGDKDELLDPDDARGLQAASGGRARLELLPGADHRFSDPVDRAGAVALAVRFLTGCLAGGQGGG